MKLKIQTITTAVAMAVVVSSCGGGGGNDDGGPSGPAPGGPLSSDTNFDIKRADAARATPKSGSVTQSSDTDGDGVTRDVVSVVIAGTDPNSIGVAVNYNNEKAVDTSDATQATLH